LRRLFLSQSLQLLWRLRLRGESNCCEGLFGEAPFPRLLNVLIL
jgi:hypothetical protein